MKSEEEYVKKLKRGWPDQPHIEINDDEIKHRLEMLNERYNRVEDYIMERYVDEVKKRINR